MKTFKVTAITALGNQTWYTKANSAVEAQMDAWDSFGEQNVKIIVVPVR